jgi:hypothetical protein
VTSRTAGFTPVGFVKGLVVLTIPEFRKPADQHLRRASIVLTVLIACLWIMSGLGSPVGWVQIHILASGPRWLAVASSLAILIAFLFLVAWLLVVWANRDPRLRCPHCNKGLVRHHFKVIATRCCPSCAGEILIDPEPQRTATLARTEVESVARRHMRRGLVSVVGIRFFAAHDRSRLWSVLVASGRMDR